MLGAGGTAVVRTHLVQTAVPSKSTAVYMCFGLHVRRTAIPWYLVPGAAVFMPVVVRVQFIVVLRSTIILHINNRSGSLRGAIV